jgi:hypothetical protein
MAGGDLSISNGSNGSQTGSAINFYSTNLSAGGNLDITDGGQASFLEASDYSYKDEDLDYYYKQSCFLGCGFSSNKATGQMTYKILALEQESLSSQTKTYEQTGVKGSISAGRNINITDDTESGERVFNGYDITAGESFNLGQSSVEFKGTTHSKQTDNHTEASQSSFTLEIGNEYADVAFSAVLLAKNISSLVKSINAMNDAKANGIYQSGQGYGASVAANVVAVMFSTIALAQNIGDAADVGTAATAGFYGGFSFGKSSTVGDTQTTETGYASNASVNVGSISSSEITLTAADIKIEDQSKDLTINYSKVANETNTTSNSVTKGWDISVYTNGDINFQHTKDTLTSNYSQKDYITSSATINNFSGSKITVQGNNGVLDIKN